MHVKAPIAALLLLVAGCASTSPHTSSSAMLTIDHALLPAATEVGGPIAAYAGFENRGPADRLLGIDCDCAASVELHTVVRDGEQMRMTTSFPLALPTGRTEVRPPGIPLHFMLIDTRRTFAVGERVPMQMRFERAGTVRVDFLVVAKSTEGWEAWRQP